MRRRINNQVFDISEKEKAVFERLNTSVKIIDYLNSIPINHERGRETCLSPRMVLRKKKAHCIEGAMLAAAALWFHGGKPLIMDLKTGRGDDDHVVALFRKDGFWGAISKTNHAVLRSRDSVYKSVRELAMSYFHEYFLDDGRKTLRSFSEPFDLSKFGEYWITAERNLWEIPRELNRAKHNTIISTKDAKKLRRADPIERGAGKLKEW